MASCILNTFNFYQCAALRCLLLLLPCCSLSWCTSRCNSTEPHRLFPASTSLCTSPEIQPWMFNRLAEEWGKQKSSANTRCSHNALMAGHLLLQGISPKPHWDDGISSASYAYGVVRHAPLATPGVIPNSALLCSVLWDRLHSGCTEAILWDLLCQLSHARGLRLPPLTVWSELHNAGPLPNMPWARDGGWGRRDC